MAGLQQKIKPEYGIEMSYTDFQPIKWETYVSTGRVWSKCQTKKAVTIKPTYVAPKYKTVKKNNL